MFQSNLSWYDSLFTVRVKFRWNEWIQMSFGSLNTQIKCCNIWMPLWNCNPTRAVYLIKQFDRLTNNNFDEYNANHQTKDPTLTFIYDVCAKGYRKRTFHSLPLLQILFFWIQKGLIWPGILPRVLRITITVYTETTRPFNPDAFFKDKHYCVIAKNLEKLGTGMPMLPLICRQAVSVSHNTLLDFLDH